MHELTYTCGLGDRNNGMDKTEIFKEYILHISYGRLYLKINTNIPCIENITPYVKELRICSNFLFKFKVIFFPKHFVLSSFKEPRC